MKQIIKSILAVILLLCIVVTAAGCGGDKNPASSQDTGVADDFFADSETVNSQDKTTDEKDDKDDAKDTSSKDKEVPKENKVDGKSWSQLLASMPKKLRGTTVTVFNWNPAAEYTGAPLVIEEFTKQTGIKVDWQTINYDVYFTRLAARVASDEAPDVVRTNTPVSTNMVSFQPLSATKFDFSDSAWDQNVMKDYTINGKAYATSLKNTHLGSVNMIFYNKALIDKYDLENPYLLWKNGKWTMNKFIQMCEEYKKATKTEHSCTGGWWEYWSMIYGIQGPVKYDGKKYSNNVKDKTFLTVTQKIAEWYNTKEYLAEGRAEEFNAGEVLFYAGQSVLARRKNVYFSDLKAENNFYAVPMPAVDGQKTYYQGRGEYEAYAIADGAKNPEAVPYFLRYFLDGGNYDLKNFFCNPQNLEVYNWCMNQKNTIWSTGYKEGGDDFGNFGSAGIASLKGNQIKSYVDANSAVIDKRVTNFNNALGKIKK